MERWNTVRGIETSYNYINAKIKLTSSLQQINLARNIMPDIIIHDAQARMLMIDYMFLLKPIN